MAPPPRRGELFGLAAALAVACVLLLRPVLPSVGTLALGSTWSEAPRHFWGLWAAARGLWDHGPFVAHLEVDFPSGYTRHLMDPVNLLFFVPGLLLGGGGATGATLGWNLVHVGWTVAGGVGTWGLARRLLGDRPGAVPAAVLAGLAAATAPYLLATPWLGRTELLPAMGWPLHLWLLHRALAPEGRRREVVAAGLSLAAVALGGWYLAGWLLLLEPPVALAMALAAGVPLRRQALRLAGVAGLAGACLLPALQALHAHPPPILGEEQRLSVHMGINTPPWLLLPFFRKQGLPGVELPAYPGAVVALLAAWGAVRDRRARGWVLLAAAILVLSLGPYLVFTNDAAALTRDPPRLPAWWVEKLVPPLRYIWGWCRIGILATPPLAVAGAFGAADLLHRLREARLQVLAILAALMLVDHGASRIPAGVLGSAFDPRPPAALVEALAVVPEGAVLQLPLDDFYMTWQPSLGRPLAESLEVEDAREQSYLVQQALRVVGDAPPLPGAPGADPDRGSAAEARLAEVLADPRAGPCLAADGTQLQTLGFAAVVLHRDRLPDAHRPVTALLTAGLGPPVVDRTDLAVWVPGRRPAPPAADCPLETVRVEVR